MKAKIKTIKCKLNAVWRVLRSDNYIVVTSKGKNKPYINSKAPYWFAYAVEEGLNNLRWDGVFDD